MLKHCLAFKTCEPSIQSPVEVSISCQDNESSRLWSPSDVDNDDGDGDWSFANCDWSFTWFSPHTPSPAEREVKGGEGREGGPMIMTLFMFHVNNILSTAPSSTSSYKYTYKYTYLHQGIQCPLGIIYISCKRIIRGRMWEKQPRWKFQKAILKLHWTLHWISMDWYNNLPKGSNLQLFWSLRQKYQPERPEHQMIIEKIKLKHKSLL